MDPSLLAIIVDTDPISWQLRGQFGAETALNFSDAISQVIVFCNAYALLHRSNRILVIANNPKKTVLIYPKRCDEKEIGQQDVQRKHSTSEDNLIPIVHKMQSLITHGLLESIAETKDLNHSPAIAKELNNIERKSSLAQSFSLALCGKNSNYCRAKVLIVSWTYIPFGNVHIYIFNPKSH
jgi:hypothetical protein